MPESTNSKRIMSRCFYKLPDGLRSSLISLKGRVKFLRNKIRTFNAKRKCHSTIHDLKGKRELKVHLGCGQDVRPGWVNIDLLQTIAPGFNPNSVKNAVFINHDLTSGLRLPESSCQYIYSCHFFEHLEYQQGVTLMQNCYQALQKGGTFRIVLPDFRRAFQAYLENDAKYFDLVDSAIISKNPEHQSIVDYINYSVYQFGEHKCIYDEEKLERLLYSIGFSSVTPSAFIKSVDADVPIRRRYSFYTEAVK